MTKEELLDLLKENLTISVDHKAEDSWGSAEMRVSILFDGETICEGFDYVFNN